MQMRNTVFLQWFVAPEGRKVGSLKRRVRSHLARREMKKVHAVVARSTFASQNVQSTPLSDHFWKLRCRKSARHCGAKHICKSKCTNTPGADHFWKLRCRKSARRCRAKHICKSKCTKHTIVGPLLEVEMSKKCTPLWREAHVKVKMLKTLGVRTTFGGSDVASRDRRRGLCTLSKVHKTWGFVAFSTTTTTTPHYTPIHYTTPQLQLHLHYILLHYTPLHYTALNYTQLHSTTLHYLPLHFTTLHYTTLHNITKLQLHNYIALHATH